MGGYALPIAPLSIDGCSVRGCAVVAVSPALSVSLIQPWEFVKRDDSAAMTQRDWIFATAMLLLQHPVDLAISDILKHLGEQSGADRAWMFEYDVELLRFRNTHEWSRIGVASFVQDLQYAPVTMIGWLHQRLIAGQAVMVNDIGALPRSAGALRAEFIRQDNKSVLSVPMYHEGRLVACMGFDAVKAPRHWSEEIGDLFRCADLISAARYGRQRLERAIEDMPAMPGSLIYLRRSGGVRGTPPHEIVGLRSSKDYTEVWLVNGAMVLDPRPLTQWLGLLPAGWFVRIHRTAIVNHQFVREVERRESGAWQLRVHDYADHWPVSRAGRAELRAYLGV